MIFGSILVGILMGVIKVAIEYDWWTKKKSERKFHSIGFAIEFIIIGVAFYISEYNWKVVAIIIISFWNTFEIFNNYSHNQSIFYVGENAFFDKLLRKITIYYEVLKLFLHIVTIVILCFIIYRFAS